MRQTRQRLDLLELLESVDEFLTAQEIHAMLQDQGSSVGLATVYRNLAKLVERSEIDTVTSSSGEIRYRACSNTHHHHITCDNCGRTVEIELADLEKIVAAASKRHGFSAVQHTVEIVGTCKACARSGASTKAPAKQR